MFTNIYRDPDEECYYSKHADHAVYLCLMLINLHQLPSTTSVVELGIQISPFFKYLLCSIYESVPLIWAKQVLMQSVPLRNQQGVSFANETVTFKEQLNQTICSSTGTAMYHKNRSHNRSQNRSLQSLTVG